MGTNGTPVTVTQTDGYSVELTKQRKIDNASMVGIVFQTPEGTKSFMLSVKSLFKFVKEGSRL